MILQPTDHLFEELHYLFYSSRQDPEVISFSCTIFSAVLAYYFTSRVERVFIVDTKNHSVVFDGKSTWDLSLGIVFENYKYPDLNIPSYRKIPNFYKFFDQEKYDSYYSKNNLKTYCYVTLVGKG